MKQHTPTRFPCLIALIAMAGVGLAFAGFPRQTDDYVNDFAGILSPTEAARLTTTLRSFESSSQVRMTVVTVEGMAQYGTGDSSIESFATRLFNHWGIGDATRNDGVMILVAKSDRKMRIEVGSGYDRSWDQRATNIIDRQMVPEFKRGNFGTGIEKGVAAMISAIDKHAGNAPQETAANGLITAKPPQSRKANGTPQAETDLADRSMTAAEAKVEGEGETTAPIAPPAVPHTSPPADKGRRSPASGSPLAIIATAAGGLAALVGGALGVGRLMRRKCPRCQAEMKAAAEPRLVLPHLSETEKLELRLRSVKFRLWQCSSCEHEEVKASPRWFSSFKPCTSCHVRSLRRTSQTLRRSTQWSRGEELITEHCEHCGFHHERTRSLPLVSSSNNSSGGGSSSSGGGGGGGRSSGGGGSGSW